MTPRTWYSIQAAADQASAELHIYGEIGASFWDDNTISAKQFMEDLKGLPEPTAALSVRVNSVGGNVFEGIAIANAIRTWAQAKEGRTVTMVIDGIAASIASAVIMAGTTIRIADNALVMVHNPMALAMGNAAEMRKLADTLDQTRESIVATYQWHSTLSADELKALMDAETWMTADEAIANGFATEKIEGLKAAACIDPRMAAKLAVPPQFQARIDALIVKPEKPAPKADQPVAAAATEVLALCREAGLDVTFAEQLVTAAAPLADVQSRIAAERSARDAAATRASEITALCTTAKLPDLAAGYVASGMPIADVRAHLTTITARLDQAEIDTNLDPDRTHTQKAQASRIDTKAIYAARNRQKE